jgi:hypothetical protein
MTPRLSVCPYYPQCGCGTQSGPHTCEWRNSASSSVDPLLVLEARTQARALLFLTCEFESVEAALGPLFDDACESGLVEQFGVDTIKAIIEKPFAEALTA